MRTLSFSLVLMLLVFTTPVQAQKQSVDEFCASHKRLSIAVMTGRQEGLLFKDALGFVETWNDPVAEDIVKKAYRLPFYNDGYLQERAIKTFAEQEHDWCLDVLNHPERYGQ